MANRMLTEEQVKEHLNIPDFRHLTKDKLIEFVSAIPDMDREVAIKTIEQFPEFSGCAKILVARCETMCNAILKENGHSTQAVMDGYKQALDILVELSKSESFGPEDKRFFAETIVEVVDKMAAFDTVNKNFLTGITKYFSLFTGGMLLVCAVVLGVKIKDAKIPYLA